MTRDQGFSLVEVLVGTLLLVIALVSLVQLLAVSTLTHHDAGEAARATYEAQSKIDELMQTDFDAPAVQITGADTLGRNVANYFDTPSDTITRRWRVQPGPIANTRLVSVRVLNRQARQYGRQIDLATVIREW
jgi:type II secretory pathway pseudopilin PulG